MGLYGVKYDMCFIRTRVKLARLLCKQCLCKYGTGECTWLPGFCDVTVALVWHVWWGNVGDLSWPSSADGAERSSVLGRQEQLQKLCSKEGKEDYQADEAMGVVVAAT